MKKTISIIIAIILLGVIGYGIYNIVTIHKGKVQEQDVYDDIDNLINQGITPTPYIVWGTEITPTPQPTIPPMVSKDDIDDIQDGNYLEQKMTKESFRNVKSINSDVIGYLWFDTGLIREPIVQAKDNDYYLRRNIYKQYHTRGTVFMNYVNKLDDDNLTIYGHNNRNNYTVKFAPLNDVYLSDEVYKRNALFSIYFENEVRDYVICYAYINNDFAKLNHQTRNFDNDQFDEFVRLTKQINKLDSITDIEYGDKLVTLQTCYRGNRHQRLIIVAKEISRHDY